MTYKNSFRSRPGFRPARTALLSTTLLLLPVAAMLSACGGGHEETTPANEPAAAPMTSAATDQNAPAEPAPPASALPVTTPNPEAIPHLPAQERGETKAAHLALKGDHKYEGDAVATCALFPNGSFQASFHLPLAPIVVLKLDSLHGSGDYNGEARVRATYSGETFRTSKAKVKVKINIATPTGTEPKDEISGSFEGDYEGEGGKGNVSGSFENCPYKLAASSEAPGTH